MQKGLHHRSSKSSTLAVDKGKKQNYDLITLIKSNNMANKRSSHGEIDFYSIAKKNNNLDFRNARNP